MMSEDRHGRYVINALDRMAEILSGLTEMSSCQTRIMSMYDRRIYQRIRRPLHMQRFLLILSFGHEENMARILIRGSSSTAHHPDDDTTWNQTQFDIGFDVEINLDDMF